MSDAPDVDPYPQNRPKTHYDAKSWGRTMPLAVEVPNERRDGRVTMAVMQFDSRTAERIGDTTETWSVTDLRRQKMSLETELALVNSKLAYIDEAMIEEQTRVAQAAVVQAQAAADAALANAQLAAENAAVALDKVEA